MKTICWDEVGGAIAIWPSPVDADACFRAAGFDEFADSDASWDGEFEALLNRVITFCETLGRPTIKRFVGIKGVRDPSPSDALLAAARDDQFRVSIVAFGPALDIITADGHPILWLCGRTYLERIKGALGTLAGELPVRHVTLDWFGLTPDEVRTTA